MLSEGAERNDGQRKTFLGIQRRRKWFPQTQHINTAAVVMGDTAEAASHVPLCGRNSIKQSEHLSSQDALAEPQS